MEKHNNEDICVPNIYYFFRSVVIAICGMGIGAIWAWIIAKRNTIPIYKIKQRHSESKN